MGRKINNGYRCSLPEFRSKEINENFEIIAKKTEEILKATNEVNVKITIKSIADKVKTFIVTDVAGGQKVPKTKNHVRLSKFLKQITKTKSRK